MANDILHLEFEGINGATSWDDLAQGLVPDYVQSCEIDTTRFYSGNSSLKVAYSGYCDYIISNVPNKFSLVIYFYPTSLDLSKSISLLYAWDDDGDSYLGVGFVNSSGNTRLEFYLGDREGNYFEDYKTIDNLLLNQWNKCEIIVDNKQTTVKLNNVELSTLTSEVDSSLLGLDYFELFFTNTAAGYWVDSVSMYTFKTAELEAVLGNVVMDGTIYQMFSHIQLEEELAGISSNIRLENLLTWKQIHIQYECSLHQREDIPVLYEAQRDYMEEIAFRLEYQNWDYYNFTNIGLLFEATRGADYSDIPFVFSVIRQPQEYSAYVMQKLYCVTSEINGFIFNDLELRDWNVRPNQTWYVAVMYNLVVLYETLSDMQSDINRIASGTADSTTFQVVLLSTDDSALDYYYQDIAYHLTLSTILDVDSIRYFMVKPLTDLSEIRHPIYNNSNIVLSKGEAELNLHTYAILGKELVLGTHLPEVEPGQSVNYVSTIRGTTKINQILSSTISGMQGDGGDSSLINTLRIAEYKELFR